MARTFGYDLDSSTALQDPPVETLEISTANKTPNGLRVMLARARTEAAGVHLLSATSAGFVDETTVVDTRAALVGRVQLQGIGLLGVATLDGGDGTASPKLRFFKQPDPVLGIGPRVSNAHFS
jgi:predicted polyphosphate/ATP-dependent NAD kinase